MAARAGVSAGARQGAKKWLASFFSEGEAAATAASARTSSKAVAKERLQIILAHQRGSQVLAGVDLQALQQELLQCVQRHIQVANGANINIAGASWLGSWLLAGGGWQVVADRYLCRVDAVKQEGQLDIFEMQVPVDGSSATGGHATHPQR